LTDSAGWKALEKTYKKRGLVIALGAGVSVGCGLPNWDELLKKLAFKCFGNRGGSLFEDLKADGYDLPAIAGMIRAQDPDRFSANVREALYSHDAFKEFYPKGVRKSNRHAFISFIHQYNPTMRAIAAMCAIKNQGKETYSINPSIHALVNFNVDALLQAYTYARYEKRLMRTVERPSAGSRPGKISMYHMHGFLRFDDKSDDLTKDAPDALVFTEQEYFDVFNEPASLFNYTFLYLLREHSCLFIGLSLKDDNIRRLLHYSRMERESAYRKELGKAPSSKKIIRHFAIMPKPKTSQLKGIVKKSLSMLGTRPIWVSDYNTEIPRGLGGIYSHGGLQWGTVYERHRRAAPGKSPKKKGNSSNTQ
jgi:hypothetical protein